MFFDWRFGVACWMLASFFFGFALSGDGDSAASAYLSAVCFTFAGACQFFFDPPTSRERFDGAPDATAGE